MQLPRKNFQRENVLRNVESRAWASSPEALAETRKEITAAHAKGTTVSGEYELDMAILDVLTRVSRSKQTPAERSMDEEATKLARANGVSEKIARAYLEREALRNERQSPSEASMSAAEIARMHGVSERIAANWLKRNTRPAPPVEANVQTRTNDTHNDNELGAVRADARIVRYVHEEE